MNETVQSKQPEQLDPEIQKLVGPFSAKMYFSEFIKIFIIAAAIILPIRLFLIQPFYVKGASMEPNFYENEYLIVDKITPLVHPYQRGEIIVFRYPKTDQHFLIKRVIGLPGERVVIQNHTITIYNKEHPNGFQLNEKTYGPRELRDDVINQTIGDHQYFVLGDNRPVSYDSERFGPVDADQIVGRVVLRGLPVQRFAFFSVPSYQ